MNFLYRNHHPGRGASRHVLQPRHNRPRLDLQVALQAFLCGGASSAAYMVQTVLTRQASRPLTPLQDTGVTHHKR